MISASKNTPRRLAWQGFTYFFVGMTSLYILFGIFYACHVWPNSALSYSNKVLVDIFLILASIGHFTLLAFLTSLPGLIILLWQPHRPYFSWVLALSFIFALFLLLIDSVIYHFFRFHLSMNLALMFLSKEGKEIFYFPLKGWLLLGLAGLLIILIVISCLWLSRELVLRRKNVFWIPLIILALPCLLASYLLFIAALFNAHGYAVMAQQPQAFPFYTKILAEIFPNSNNAFRLLENSGTKNIIQPDKNNLLLNYPRIPLQTQPVKRLPNIVWIVVDTWRPDTLTNQIMPNVRHFADQSLWFQNHRSGGNATEPGIFSLFYSLPGTYWSAMLKQQRAPIFMDELRRNHYQFAIYGSAPLSMPAFNKTVFLGVPHLSLITPGSNVSERDQRITQDFLSFLKQKQPQPFFGFLFYDAAHSYCVAANANQPFQPAIPTCDGLFPGKSADFKPYINRYWNALSQVDQQVGRVLNTLQQQKLLQNTIVIITGDHGEEFDDNHQGYWGHASNYTQYQLDTPLLLYWPGKEGTRIHYATSHYDVVPTFLQTIFGSQTAPQNYSVGDSLFRPHPQKYYIAASYINFAVITPQQTVAIFTDGIELSDPQAKPLYQANIDQNALRYALNSAMRFYAH